MPPLFGSAQYFTHLPLCTLLYIQTFHLCISKLLVMIPINNRDTFIPTERNTLMCLEMSWLIWDLFVHVTSPCSYFLSSVTEINLIILHLFSLHIRDDENRTKKFKQI